MLMQRRRIGIGLRVLGAARPELGGDFVRESGHNLGPLYGPQQEHNKPPAFECIRGAFHKVKLLTSAYL